MKNLMYETVCSNIRLTELKLKRIGLLKQRLVETKPNRLNSKKIKIWQTKLKELEQEEEHALKELAASYIDLENFLN